MITFTLSILALLAGYFFYSRLVERVFVIDPNKATPAITMADGVDYVTMPAWKIFLIQFLNIAGLGPIFGAVAGAMWGPVAFLWIALGSVLAGGVRSEEHTSELQSLMRISYAVFCLKKKKPIKKSKWRAMIYK